MACKKQRENYGDGSITPKLDKDGKQIIDKQGRPVWLVCLSFGYEKITDKNGKTRKKQNKIQRVFHGTLGEARKFKKELASQYENVDITASKEKTFADVCESWEASTRNAGKVTEGAMVGYLVNLEHMRGKIGAKPLLGITSQQVESALTEIRDEIGFPDLCMHELRHTQATQLLGQHVDLKTVQARLGHVKASYTLYLYAHAIPANDRDAANIMGSIAYAPAKSTADVVHLNKTA